jgi:hypothetical protein
LILERPGIAPQELMLIAFDSRQQCFDVVRVNVRTGGDWRGDASDRPAEFVNQVAGAEVAKRNFVALLDMLPDRDVVTVELQILAWLEIAQRHRDVVIRMDLDGRRKRFGNLLSFSGNHR